MLPFIIWSDTYAAVKSLFVARDDFAVVVLGLQLLSLAVESGVTL